MHPGVTWWFRGAFRLGTEDAVQACGRLEVSRNSVLLKQGVDERTHSGGGAESYQNARE